MSGGRRLAALLVMILGQVSLAYAETVASTPVVDHLATPRARTDVLAYLAWLWVAIAVFIYILRLMIVEADRAYRLDVPLQKTLSSKRAELSENLSRSPVIL